MSFTSHIPYGRHPGESRDPASLSLAKLGPGFRRGDELLGGVSCS